MYIIVNLSEITATTLKSLKLPTLRDACAFGALFVGIWHAANQRKIEMCNDHKMPAFVESEHQQQHILLQYICRFAIILQVSFRPQSYEIQAAQIKRRLIISLYFRHFLFGVWKSSPNVRTTSNRHHCDAILSGFVARMQHQTFPHVPSNSIGVLSSNSSNFNNVAMIAYILDTFRVF